MARVELHRVSKVFPDGTVAVHDLDLTIEDGELFVIVGPSGCGKTSVLRMVAGLEEVSAGEVTVDGEPVVDVRTRDRDLAMLFQDCALYPHLTVRENLSFPLRMAKVRHREVAARVVETARLLSVDDVLDLAPRRLSGGQQQRVAMGKAIIKRPSLLLMDEPMSNLDAKLRVELRAQIAMMQRRSAITTLFVTHDQVEAMSLGQRVAVMRAGRLVQCAPPHRLYLAPRDLFVATFVGVPAMNVLAGRIGRDPSGEPEVRVGRHRLPAGRGVGRWPELGSWIGREVAVGIRPESLVLDPEGGIPVEVTHVEHHGHEQFVHATIDVPSVVDDGGVVRVVDEPSTTLVAALGGSVEVNLWRPIHFGVVAEELHLFDLSTGVALPAAAPSLAA